jgi:hypothetical protein
MGFGIGADQPRAVPESGSVKGQWMLEARTWGHPAPQSIHEWHVLAAGAAHQLDPTVSLPERLTVTTPEMVLAAWCGALSLGAISTYPRGDSARPTDALLAGQRLDVGRGETMAIQQIARNVHVGDRIKARGLHGHPSRRGEIVELLGSANREHYRVRWDEKQESIVYPADGVIITTERATTLGTLAEESD